MNTTAHDLAARISDRRDVDIGFAAEVVETYIAQIEGLDGREIDRDDITKGDADAITYAFVSAHRHGNFGVPDLDDVAAAADAADQAQDALSQAWNDRDRAIRRALARGARVADVMDAAGVSRARIDQIRKNER